MTATTSAEREGEGEGARESEQAGEGRRGVHIADILPLQALQGRAAEERSRFGACCSQLRRQRGECAESPRLLHVRAKSTAASPVGVGQKRKGRQGSERGDGAWSGCGPC